MLVSFSLSLSSPAATATSFQSVIDPPSDPADNLPRHRARVLYDYDAKDASELSLLFDEVITVREVPGMEADYVLGERGTKKGKVPKAFLEIMSH